MKDVFAELKAQTDSWASLALGCVNGSPVAARVMENIEAPFHTHQSSDEFFLVLSGSLFIETDQQSIELHKGQSYTVKAGTRHRARAERRAELIMVGGQDA